MVCALLTSSYPIQTVAAETDVEETTPIAQADVQEEDDKEAVQNEAEQHSEAEEANRSSEVSKEKESVEDQTKTSKEEETTELTTEETGSKEEATTEEEITSEEETTKEEETTSEEETTTEEETTSEEETTTEETTTDASLQISNIIVNDMNLSYVSGKGGSKGYYEAEVGGSVQAALQMNTAPAADPDSDTDADPKTAPISKSCTVKLIIKNADGKEKTLDTQTITLNEGDDAQTISVSGTVKITQSGKYSVRIEVTGDDLSDTSKTKDVEVTVPEAISVKEFTLTSLNVTSVDKIMDNDVCTGYKISYALKTNIVLDGMDDKISLNDRKDEIKYSLERKQYTINSNRKKIAGGNYAQESIIDKLINSNGQSPDCMIEGDFTVNTAGEYQLQAVANKETVTSEAVTVEKLDQTAVFETQQDAFHFNEAVRYELTDGICIGNAKYFVSDEQGAAVRNSNVKITYDKNDKSYSIIVANLKKDTTADVYFTVIYAGNNIYKEWKQTYKLSLTRKKAQITYTADKNNDPYMYCDKITYTIPKEYNLADVTCTEVDKDGQPVSEQQLSIKVNNSSKKNITVENNNSNNEDKSTAYLRFYYSGNDNYDADEQIVTLNFAKLDNEVKYTPSCTQTSHEYGEKVTFKYETGVDTKDITCYESDEDGKEIEDAKHLSIQKDGKDFIVKGTALSDSETPYYVTIKYAKNGVYKEASQTFEFGVHKINLHGDITVNENKLSVIFGKNKKMLITVTMESDFDNLTKDDVNKIDFALVASDDKEQIPLAATLKSRKSKYHSESSR